MLRGPSSPYPLTCTFYPCYLRNPTHLQSPHHCIHRLWSRPHTSRPCPCGYTIHGWTRMSEDLDTLCNVKSIFLRVLVAFEYVILLAFLRTSSTKIMMTRIRIVSRSIAMHGQGWLWITSHCLGTEIMHVCSRIGMMEMMIMNCHRSSKNTLLWQSLLFLQFQIFTIPYVFRMSKLEEAFL